MGRHRVGPGTRVRLDTIDPGDTGSHGDEAAARATLARDIERLAGLQDRLYAAQRHAVLIVLQGLDTAGKDGTVKHVMSGVNPSGCEVVPFKVPTEEEAAHDFLWRAHRAAPRRGHTPSSTARTTKTCWCRACTAPCRARSCAGATPRSTPS